MNCLKTFRGLPLIFASLLVFVTNHTPAQHQNINIALWGIQAPDVSAWQSQPKDSIWACDTSSNICDTMTLHGYIFDNTCPGYWTTQNCNTWLKFAERINGNGYQYVYGMRMAVLMAKYAAPSSTVNITIWNDGATPGAVIYSETVPVNTFQSGYWNNYIFDHPITVNGNFYIGYEVNNVPGDTFGLFCREISSSGNTAWVYTPTGWTSYPTINPVFNSSLGLFVFRCNYNTPPEAEFIADTNVIYPNTILNFTNQSTLAPWTYTWKVIPMTGVYFYSGSHIHSVNPRIRFTQTGDFTIRLIATNPAGSDTMTKTNYIHVIEDIGIQENNQFPMKLYPNPATEYLRLEFARDAFAELEMNISDAIGRPTGKVVFRKISPGTFEIDIRSLPKGNYLLTVKSGNCTGSQPFQKF